MCKKLIHAILLMSLVLFPSVSSAENVFLWPDSVHEAHAHACKKERRTVEQLQGKSLLKGPEDASGYDEITDQFDLDGDGVCELYLKDTFASGTGGYAEGIFQKKGDFYYLVLELFGYDLRLAERKNGHLQLIYHEGERAIPVLYSFDGKKYVQVKTPPWNRDAYYNKGLQKYRQKDYRSAEVYFLNALRVRSWGDTGYGIRNNLALCYYRNNDYAKAERVLNEIIRDINNNSGYAGDAAAAFYNLGLIYEKKDDSAKSLFYFKKSLELSPSDLRRQKVREMENRLSRRVSERGV